MAAHTPRTCRHLQAQLITTCAKEGGTKAWIARRIPYHVDSNGSVTSGHRALLLGRCFREARWDDMPGVHCKECEDVGAGQQLPTGRRVLAVIGGHEWGCDRSRLVSTPRDIAVGTAEVEQPQDLEVVHPPPPPPRFHILLRLRLLAPALKWSSARARLVECSQHHSLLLRRCLVRRKRRAGAVGMQTRSCSFHPHAEC